MKSSSASLAHEESVLGKAYDARIVRRLWRFVRPYRALVLGSFLLLLGVASVQLVQPYLVKRAIDVHILGNDPDGLLPLGLFFLARCICSL